MAVTAAPDDIAATRVQATGNLWDCAITSCTSLRRQGPARKELYSSLLGNENELAKRLRYAVSGFHC